MTFTSKTRLKNRFYNPPKGARQKKTCILSLHSAKALTPTPYQLAVQKWFYARFFLHIDIYMFLEPANSEMENALKIQNVNWKYSYTSETGTEKNNTF